MKTPEEKAVEYATTWYIGADGEKKMGPINPWKEEGYLAGYQAKEAECKEEMRRLKDELSSAKMGFYAAKGALFTSGYYINRMKELLPHDVVGKIIDEAHKRLEEIDLEEA